ncbi:hypothetical protein FRB99_001411 [Tulasnella sp. 403]|nr:hypothetical protein FRB99_001411 [Tulasnella sp. 403]
MVSITTRAIYGSQLEYQFISTTGDTLQDVASLPEPGSVGDIVMHHHPSGAQVWIGKREKPRLTLVWVKAHNGIPHPELGDYVLSLWCDIPQWVKAGTFQNQKYKQNSQDKGKLPARHEEKFLEDIDDDEWEDEEEFY